MPLDTTASSFTTCTVCGGQILTTDAGHAYCPRCDPTEGKVAPLWKSPAVRARQELMVEALRAGDRPRARYLAHVAASFRQADATMALLSEAGDWVDRCGWPR